MAAVAGNSMPTLSKGFTLIEMMTVLAVAAILLGIGIPSFRSLIENQRMTAVANDFFAAINLARSEAIKRGARVDMVPAGVGDDWAEGWVVFVDADDDQRPDTGEPIIYAHGPVHESIAIIPRLTNSSKNSPKQYIAYNGTGRTRTNANSQTPQVGSMEFKSDEQIRKISVNFLGRARVCNPGPDGKGC
jgi:type IV fimbrial biogenesis protein FimT